MDPCHPWQLTLCPPKQQLTTGLLYPPVRARELNLLKLRLRQCRLRPHEDNCWLPSCSSGLMEPPSLTDASTPYVHIRKDPLYPYVHIRKDPLHPYVHIRKDPLYHLTYTTRKEPLYPYVCTRKDPLPLTYTYVRIHSTLYVHSRRDPLNPLRTLDLPGLDHIHSLSPRMYMILGKDQTKTLRRSVHDFGQCHPRHPRHPHSLYKSRSGSLLLASLPLQLHRSTSRPGLRSLLRLHTQATSTTQQTTQQSLHNKDS
jgi:hypothetical protein